MGKTKRKSLNNECKKKNYLEAFIMGLGNHNTPVQITQA